MHVCINVDSLSNAGYHKSTVALCQMCVKSRCECGVKLMFQVILRTFNLIL